MTRLRFLIASGPTQEPLDPVRFLSNYSTGAMGERLAEAAKKRGHPVTHIRCPQETQTALVLRKRLFALLPKNDVLLMAAAVCDFRPARASEEKIKKEALRNLRLVRNPDILADLKRIKKKNQVFIGFGIESKKILENGYQKLKNKGLELIVLQRVTPDHTPFGDRAVEAILLTKDKKTIRFASISKKKLAVFLVREAEKIWREKRAAMIYVPSMFPRGNISGLIRAADLTTP